ncbi:MAG: MFS transporter [Candidatus Heimdallarchaeota archaeon]|nr:MFS transporter [Candidatus Heimdallarchaeota archaeon]MCK4291170.1 MFS transporter [Candidatus Heimdallarchaeota archaeon]
MIEMLETETKQPEIQTNMKGFMFFWSGQLVSILGSSIIQFVLTWWITVETGSPLLLSLAMFVGFIPTIILTPIAGVFVDRWNRKALIGTVDFLQAAVTVVLLFLFMYGFVSIPILLIFLAIRGVFQAFHQPAVMSLIPIMVPRKHLGRINSIDYFFNSIIFLIGPIIAAFLYKFIAIQHILWIDAASFSVAVIPLIFIKIPKLIKEKVESKEKKKFFEDFKEGFVFIKEKKGLLPLLSAFTGANFFIMPLFTLLNLFIYSTHAGTETNLASVLAFNQAGMIVGSILFIIWKGFKKKVLGVIIGLMCMYSGFLFLTFAPEQWFWFIGIGFLIIGFGLPMANISSQTIWQSVVPKEKLGRVMSVRIAIAQFTAPLGMILSGVITDAIARRLSKNVAQEVAEALSIKYIFIGATVLGIVFLAISWLFTSMRHVEKGIIPIEDEEEELSIEDKELKLETDDLFDAEPSTKLTSVD